MDYGPLPHATAFTAGQQVLRGDLHIHLAVAVDTHTVGDGLGSTKCLWAKEQRHNTTTQIQTIKIEKHCLDVIKREARLY